MSNWIRINDENWVKASQIERVYRPDKDSALYVVLGGEKSSFMGMESSNCQYLSIEKEEDQKFFLARWKNYMKKMEGRPTNDV